MGRPLDARLRLRCSLRKSTRTVAAAPQRISASRHCTLCSMKLFSDTRTWPQTQIRAHRRGRTKKEKTAKPSSHQGRACAIMTANRKQQPQLKPLSATSDGGARSTRSALGLVADSFPAGETIFLLHTAGECVICLARCFPGDFAGDVPARAPGARSFDAFLQGVGGIVQARSAVGVATKAWQTGASNPPAVL